MTTLNARSPRVAVVTGAGGGIGLSVAARLLAAGYRVGLLDRDGDLLRRGMASLDADDRALALDADVRVTDHVENAVAAVEHAFGPLTAAVCAAGVLRPATILESSDDDWSDHLDVNATGTFRTLRATARTLVAHGGGSIVVVGSNAASVARRSMGAYSASKAAVWALTRCLGLEVAEHGVRCNVVDPGSTDTAMQADLWPHRAEGLRATIDGDATAYRAGIPLGRIADPQDIAEVVEFLLSDRARHITMQRVVVDGGASL